MATQAQIDDAIELVRIHLTDDTVPTAERLRAVLEVGLLSAAGPDNQVDEAIGYLGGVATALATIAAGQIVATASTLGVLLKDSDQEAPTPLDLLEQTAGVLREDG
jgi:hypothetical protein